MTKPHDPKRLERFVELAGAGYTITQIAEATGTSVVAARGYARAHGIKVANGGKSGLSRKALHSLLRECADAGMIMREAAEAIGIGYGYVSQLSCKHGIKFRRPCNAAKNNDRAEVMASMYRAGKTLQEIGEVYGVTRERVRQLIKKYEGLTGKDGGAAKKAEHTRARRAEQMEARYLKKFGCSVAQMSYLREAGRQYLAAGGGRYSAPLTAYRQQRNNAKSRGIDWNLTPWEWWQCWQDSGHWNERGRAADKYVMCRFSDAGAYERGNVYIATLSHNSSVQANNPMRLGHPDHDRVVAEIKQRRQEAA